MRRSILSRCAMIVMAMTSSAAAAFLPEDDMQFLADLTADVVEASRVRPGAKVGEIGPNITGGTVIRPGGRDCYPAFWIRDYAMSLESGLVPADEQRHMLFLTAKHQQDSEWRLPSGSIVPPGSIADHISFGDKPIFYPGTLEDYEGQGGERWGIYPALDDHFFFIHMAAQYVKDSGSADILIESVNDKPLLQRLDEAYAMPPSRADSGLVYADPENRGVTFGFVDTITHTGDLFFCSVLKYRAARELSNLFKRADDSAKAADYTAKAETLKAAINDTFAHPGGLMKASTGASSQPDVWGTAFAIYVDALTPERAQMACTALRDAYRAGTLAWRGNIRHVLTTNDFSDATAWEKALGPKNRYQNGAYWNTPTGWVAYAIARADLDGARDLAREFIAELREGDYRQGPDYGSPWECIHPEANHRQNPVYMTSVTCPLAAFRRIEVEFGG